jgi:hypothetical protein
VCSPSAGASTTTRFGRTPRWAIGHLLHWRGRLNSNQGKRVAARPRPDAVGAGGEQVELAVDAVQGEVHTASELTQ